MSEVPRRDAMQPRTGGGAARCLTVLALALLGVTAHVESAAAQSRSVTLWHAYGEAEAEGLQQALDAFEREHPNIDVSVVHNAFGAYASKLESAIPTGRGPDVFIDAHERLVTYAERGLVDPLGEPGLEARLDFEEAHLDAVRVGGELHGLPLALKCAALYVNEELVSRAPRTLEEIAALRSGLPDDHFALVYEAESAYYDVALLHAYGGALIDDEGNYAFGGEPAERMLGHIQDLLADGVIPEEPNGDLVKQMFMSGRAATAISGPWLAPELPDGLRWRVYPLPRVEATGTVMEPYVTVEGAYMAHGSADPEASRLLITFLSTRSGAVLRARHGQQVVASKSAWSDPALANDDFLRTFREAASLGRPMSTHSHMRLVFEPTERAIRRVLRGDTPVEVAVAQAHRRFQDVIRPPPEARNPTMAFVVIGLLLMLVTIYMVRRASDVQFRGQLRASLPAYRYVAHAFVAVGLLVIAPLLVGGAISFFTGRGTDLDSYAYVGLANYVDILTARGGDLLGNGSFWLVLLVTVTWTLLNVGLHLVLGIALALLLNRPTLAFKGPYRVLLILPWAVPNYVTALSWKGMFHRQFGAINAILDSVGIEPVSWFGQWSTAFSANVATNVWLGFPFMMVVTLGALSAIPRDLYEAASVDGATKWQQFRLITMPMLWPMLAPAVAMGSVWTFNMFNVVFLVSGGEPDGGTEILVSEAYRWAFTRSSQYGYAAAYAVLIFGILLVLTRSFAKRLEGMGEAR